MLTPRDEDTLLVELDKRLQALESARKLLALVNAEGNISVDPEVAREARRLSAFTRGCFISVQKTWHGYVLVDGYGSQRRLTLLENLAWRFLGAVPVRF